MSAPKTQSQFIGDHDFSATHFAPAQVGEKTSVLVYRNAEGAQSRRGGRLEFQLCSDADRPLVTRYGIDSVRDEGNPNRRGLALKITEPKALAALKQLDEVIVRTAIERSKEWFKKALTEEQVRARYKPVVSKVRDEDDFEVMKVKVKAGDVQVPTELHLRDVNGRVRKHGATIEDLERPGAEVVPIVSAYALWFMGGGSSFGLSFQVEKMIVRPGEERDTLDEFASSVPLRAADEPEAKAVKLEAAGDDDVVVDTRDILGLKPEPADDGDAAM